MISKLGRQIELMWSDAAREASAAARKASKAAVDEPIKRSTDGMPRADSAAYLLTKEAGKASNKAVTKDTGQGSGMDQDSRFT